MHPMHVNVDLKALQEMDGGRIGKCFQAHVQRAANDCDDRPNDKTKRKVIIELHITPVPDTSDPKNIYLDRCDVEVECKSKLPTHRSKVIQMKPHARGLLTNRDFPDDLNQVPMFPADEGENE